MNKLSLSVKRDKALPESVTVNGVVHPIDADFRTQLKIFRLLDDPEIAERHKHTLACSLFFGANGPKNGMDVWQEWVQGEKRERDPDAPEMSYEEDAGDIYASFLCQYGIDLLDEKTRMHWYQFTALLYGLKDDTPLMRTLSVRGLDTSMYTGKAKVRAERAKRNARLPERISDADRKTRDALNAVLLRGGDPGEVLGRNSY